MTALVSHLKLLEAESIHIFREAAAQGTLADAERDREHSPRRVEQQGRVGQLEAEALDDHPQQLGHADTGHHTEQR